MLEVVDLSFSYNDKEIIKKISFSAEGSTIISILGPNGAGKTTLIKLIAGILKRYRGKIFIKGKNLISLKEKEKAKFISYVPQNFNSRLPFTVHEILSMGRYPYTSPFSSEQINKGKIKEYAMETGIEGILNRCFSTLSGGEQRIVLVTRALIQETPIILLDEPGSFLDLYHEHSFLKLLLRLRDKGKLVILVTHNLNTASLYSDTVIILKNGGIRYIGKPEDVLTYKNIYETFGVEVYYTLYPGTQKPVIAPLRFPIPLEKK